MSMQALVLSFFGLRTLLFRCSTPSIVRAAAAAAAAPTMGEAPPMYCLTVFSDARAALF